MDDLIRRKEAIDAICKACYITEDYHKCDGYPETSTWCEELVALRALPSAQPHWIPCSGRLPENEPNYVEYEVTIERGDGTRYVTTSFWIESCGAWEWNDYGVIAWRELSEPYGGESE